MRPFSRSNRQAAKWCGRYHRDDCRDSCGNAVRLLTITTVAFASPGRKQHLLAPQRLQRGRPDRRPPGLPVDCPLSRQEIGPVSQLSSRVALASPFPTFAEFFPATTNREPLQDTSERFGPVAPHSPTPHVPNDPHKRPCPNFTCSPIIARLSARRRGCRRAHHRATFALVGATSTATPATFFSSPMLPSSVATDRRRI